MFQTDTFSYDGNEIVRGLIAAHMNSLVYNKVYKI
jgi:hypothetical protein